MEVEERVTWRTVQRMDKKMIGKGKGVKTQAGREYSGGMVKRGKVVTHLLQGWTNTVAIFHDDITFVLEPGIPHITRSFVDDCSVKGLASRYEISGGGYDTIPNNPSVRKFIWEHLSDIHRILHCFRCAGATISAKKLFIMVLEVIILRHKCNYAGRVPDDSKIAKICDWPPCQSITDVRAFLSTAGFMQMWIRNYSATVHPLTDLTCKGTVFAWDDTHATAMQALKDVIIASPALISINYTSNHPVYLAVDSSVRSIG